MKTTAKTLLAASLLVLAGCGALYVELESRQVGATVPDQSFPPMMGPGTTFCGLTRSCTTTGFTFDLGSDVDVIEQDHVSYELRLTGLAIANASTDLSGVASARVVLIPADGSGSVVLATYARPASGRTTSLVASAFSDVDLRPYVQRGTIHLQAQLVYDTMTAGFTADVDAVFHLKARMDYGEQLGL